jgi:hypothetical protein
MSIFLSNLKAIQITDSLIEARSALDKLLSDEHAIEQIALAAKMLAKTFKEGSCVFACGNGGSLSPCAKNRAKPGSVSIELCFSNNRRICYTRYVRRHYMLRTNNCNRVHHPVPLR